MALALAYLAVAISVSDARHLVVRESANPYQCSPKRHVEAPMVLKPAPMHVTEGHALQPQTSIKHIVHSGRQVKRQVTDVSQPPAGHQRV